MPTKRFLYNCLWERLSGTSEVEPDRFRYLKNASGSFFLEPRLLDDCSTRRLFESLSFKFCGNVCGESGDIDRADSQNSRLLRSSIMVAVGVVFEVASLCRVLLTLRLTG